MTIRSSFLQTLAPLAVVACMLCGAMPSSATEKSRALALLEAGNYEQLDRELNALQRGYLQGTVGELDLLQNFRGFYATDPALEARFDAWIQRYPKSYAGRLARGIYHKRVGMDHRGDKSTSQTERWRFAKMETAFQKAMVDLEASLELEAKPVLSHLYMMDIQKHSGPLSIRVWLFRFKLFDPAKYTPDKALEIAPNSFLIRRKYMHTLETRWGGSSRDMAAFLAECKKAKLKPDEINLLEALVYEDRGWVRYSSRDFPGAFDAYQRAAALIDLRNHGLFEHGMRARFLWGIASGYQGVQRHEEALPYFDQAIAAGADEADVYFSRGISFDHSGQKKAAFEDYVRAAERGNVWCQNQVGTHYWHGILVQKNPREAVKWFTLAAEQGSAEAKKNLEWAKKLSGT